MKNEPTDPPDRKRPQDQKTEDLGLNEGGSAALALSGMVST